MLYTDKGDAILARLESLEQEVGRAWNRIRSLEEELTALQILTVPLRDVADKHRDS